MPIFIHCSDACVAHLVDLSIDDESSTSCSSNSNSSCCHLINKQHLQQQLQEHQQKLQHHPYSSPHNLLLPITPSSGGHMHRNIPPPLETDSDSDDEVFTSADQEVRQVMSANITLTRRHAAQTANSAASSSAAVAQSATSMVAS